MAKWIRRILYFTVFVLVLALVATYVFHRMSLATPEWWMPQYTDESQWRVAANRMDQKLASAVSRVAELYAVEAQQQHASTPRPTETDPAQQGNAVDRPGVDDQTVAVEITDEELNAYFHKWRRLNGWDQALGKYVSDLQIHLEDDRVIIGGKVVGMEMLEGRILHAHFRPKLNDQGQLTLNLQGVWSGRLPLPAATWTSQRERLLRAIDVRLPQLRRNADMNAQGHSNEYAVAAAMGELLLAVLHDQPADPVVFVPLAWGGIEGAGVASVPVRLTEVRVEQQTLKLVALPLTPQERQAYLQRLQNGK